MIRFLASWFFQNTGNPGSRFLQGDNPTEQTFRNFLNSIAFIRRKEDTAKLNEQGLAKCTDDPAAETRDSSQGPEQMTKFIQAHQLPNVKADTGFGGLGVKITEVSSTLNRTGGSGKDFLIKNTHQITGIPPISVTSQYDVTTDTLLFSIEVDQAQLNALETGRVRVTSNDTTLDYLFQKLVSLNPNLVFTVLGAGGNESMAINWVERVGEVKMFFGDVATVFAGSYNNTPGHVWRGWALCNGGTYNSILTPDMRGNVPVGYNPDVIANPKYSTLGSHQDDLGDSGENEHTLTRGELPKHVHMITNGVDNASQSDPGNHTHSYNNWPSQADIGEGGTTATDNSVETAQVTGGAGAHRHTGNTGDGTSDPGGLGALNNDPHENRQPFTVLAYIMYVGF